MRATIGKPKVAALGFVVCLAALTCACGSRTTPATLPVPLPSTPEPPPSPRAPTAPPRGSDPLDCALITEPGNAIATVALTDRVDSSNAPYPSNESERLLFRQLYETLIRVDCNGRARPGLAASWRLDADGRTWIVSLRESAQFSDGTAVTASNVRASWMRDGNSDELRPQVSRLVQSIVAVDDRTLAITLRRQRSDVPLALAHTDLAIAKAAADAPRPLGTRSAPSIRFVDAAGDARDLLDQAVDLLLTRDPAALAYAATLPQFQSVPLEWQRIHVLLTPSRAPSFSESARQALAGDAVRGDARSAMGPFWWEMLQDCAVAPYSTETREGPIVPRVVHDTADRVARDLAERLVGLNLYRRPTGLTGAPLAAARRRGRDAGYLMSVARRPLDPCREIQSVMDDVPWLDPATIVPLVETRLWAIVRRGRSGVVAEWDGGLLIAGASGPR
jgi:hypothetical protein